MIHRLPAGHHAGEPVETLTDLPFLTGFREVCDPASKHLLDAVDNRIRELRRLGYGRCRPTPKLPQQIR